MKDYSDVIAMYWSTIIEAWREHGSKHAVIECDLARRKVLAFPAKDYINTLSKRTRGTTLRQYQKITVRGGLMVFINDSDDQILQSYIFSKDDLQQTTCMDNEPMS